MKKFLLAFTLILSAFLISACSTKNSDIYTENEKTQEDHKLNCEQNKEGTWNSEKQFCDLKLRIPTITYGLQVASKTVECTGVVPQNCLLTKAPSDPTWVYFYDTIEGFKYKPGYEYLLSVTKTLVPNPPTDASSYTYKLEKIVKKAKKDSDIRTESEKPIFESTWRLKRLKDKDVSSKKGFMTFNKDSVNLYIGCNNMSISLSSSDKNLLSFGEDLRRTLMACQDKTEDMFIETLKTITQFEKQNEKMFLKNSDNNIVIELVR